MSEQGCGFNGLWIPERVWADKSLNLMEKAIIADVIALGEYYKTNDAMADFFGVSLRHLQRVLEAMEEKGLIVRIARTDKKGRNSGRIIKITDEYRQKLLSSQPSQKVDDENVRDDKNVMGGRQKCRGVGDENVTHKIHIENTKENTPYSTSSSHSTNTKYYTTSSHQDTKPKEQNKQTKKELECDGVERKPYERPTSWDTEDYAFTKCGDMGIGEDFFWYYFHRDWCINGERIRDWRALLDSWIAKKKKRKGDDEDDYKPFHIPHYGEPLENYDFERGCWRS